jgi:hypothetical protein
MDAKTRQILAFRVGDRRRDRAKALWAKIPWGYRAPATCHPDQDAVSTGMMPAERHKASTKHARTTNRIERVIPRGGCASLVWSATRWRSPRNWPITAVLSSLSSAPTLSRRPQHDLCSTTSSIALVSPHRGHAQGLGEIALEADSPRGVDLGGVPIGRPIALRQLRQREMTPAYAEKQRACHAGENEQRLPNTGWPVSHCVDFASLVRPSGYTIQAPPALANT